jgi:nucleoid-associated protein YgaU
MPNDAKLAMVLGVGIVVAVAIVFFHKDLVNGYGSGDRAPANGVNPPAPDPAAPAGGQRRLLTGHPTAQIKAAAGSRRHTVAEGDTLYGLAERYYGDGEHFLDIYEANRDVLKRPDRLEAGAVLVIPDLPAAP